MMISFNGNPYLVKEKDTVASKSLLLDVMEPRRRRKCIARVAVIVQGGGQMGCRGWKTGGVGKLRHSCTERSGLLPELFDNECVVRLTGR